MKKNLYNTTNSNEIYINKNLIDWLEAYGSIIYNSNFYIDKDIYKLTKLALSYEDILPKINGSSIDFINALKERSIAPKLIEYGVTNIYNKCMKANFCSNGTFDLKTAIIYEYRIKSK